MTKQEENTIRNVIRQLRGESYTTDEVHAALTGPARIWLDTWIIGALECLLPGPERDPRLGESLSSPGKWRAPKESSK